MWCKYFFLFIVAAVVEMHSNRFEIYTLVIEIYRNVDLALGFKKGSN